MSLQSGIRLGPYEILSPLGAGGMGEVYKARDTRLGREVAIKVLPPGVATDPERLRRFEQEARAAAALNHPNILVLHDLGTHDGAPYIVTELLEGESLRQRLRGGPIATTKAVDMSVQIAQGLAAAHEKGIVHRDLKPENIFVTKDGRAKILDFGLARLTPQELPQQGAQSGAPTADSPTREGRVLGTVGYMSPEQARGQPADARSDIFSFGTVLYEMLSGKKAFSRDSTVDTLSAILHEDPPELDRLSSSFSLPLVQLLRRCLEKKPEDRFSTAHDLAFALQTIGSSGDLLATRPGAARASVIRWTRRHRVATVSLCAFLLAAVLSGVLLWHPWKTKPSPTASTTAAVKPSLVALPCKVLGSPESVYLTDAIPSTLSTLLGEVQGMDTRVPPTSFEVGNVKGDLAKIAQAYQVQCLVMTTVTAQADRLVLNVQLVEAQTRKLRWSHQYVGATAGYNDMAREAALGICKALLPEAALSVPASGATSNSEAELARQQGDYYAVRYNNHGDRADFGRALAAFNRALELSPKDAETAGRVANLYVYALAQDNIPLDEGLAAGEAWVQKALALDPQCGEAWASRARLEADKLEADMEKQIEWAVKAAQVGPGNPSAQFSFAVIGLATGGSLVLGAEALREQVRQAPLASQGYGVLAEFLADLGHPEQALPVLETELALDPGDRMALACKTYVLSEMGRTKEATEIFNLLEAGEHSGDLSLFVQALKWILSLAAGGDRDAGSSLKEIMATFADPASVWNALQWDIDLLLPVVNRRFGKDVALDLLILSTRRGGTYPYDALMLRPDLKELREDPRAKDVIQKTKSPFDMLIRILQDARSRRECPKYLEKPMDDLLKDLESRGAWP